MTDGLRLAVVIDASVPRKVWRFIDKRTSSRRDPRSGGLLVSVHTGMFYDQLPVVVHLEYYEYLSTGCSPFRTAVPFWGQITQSLTDLSPKRDCSTKRVYSVGVMGSISPSYVRMEFLFRKCHQLPVLYTYCCRRAPIIAIVPTPAAIRRESAKEEGAEPFLP